MKEWFKAWFGYTDDLYDPPRGLFIVAAIVAAALALLF